MMRVERPEWHERGKSGPRVLIENPDLGTGFAIERVLERAGYDVAVCGGPDALRGHQCPLIAEGRCGLAEGADVIVHSLNPDRLEHLTVLRGLRARHPHTPLVVEVPTPAVKRHPGVLAGCTILPLPATRESLLRAVRSSLESAATQTSSDRPARGSFLVGDGDAFACEHCGADHTVFTIAFATRDVDRYEHTRSHRSRSNHHGQRGHARCAPQHVPGAGDAPSTGGLT